MILSMQSARALLKPRIAGGGSVDELSPGVWRLEIPGGEEGHYRLAQLDDDHGLHRTHFPWQPPRHISLRARASASDLPGTWGFGLWNDPFSLSLGLRGGQRRFPVLPNAAWFFHASRPNYLSFRNDLPAQGFLAATFRSKPLPAALLAAGTPLGAALVVNGIAQGVRWLLRRIIDQDTRLIEADVTAWHKYELDWESDQVNMRLDGRVVLDTHVTPLGPLMFILWIDNQFASLPPRGRGKFGTLPTPGPAWIEISFA